MISEMLEEAGYTKVYNLTGGMAAWCEQLTPVKIADLKDGGKLCQFIRLGKGWLSYLIESNGEAAVIDISRNIEACERFVSEYELKMPPEMGTDVATDD